MFNKFFIGILRYLCMVSFIASTCQVSPSYGQELTLPSPTKMVGLSVGFEPAVLRGIKIHPENPLEFNFLVDLGQQTFTSTQEERSQYRTLVKYFLASLAIPEQDLWVNLSPYEKNRIIPTVFGKTEMGRDLLGQDYILKQLTSSLMYPESRLGRKFWDNVYARAYKLYGNVSIPINTFNKVWIVPDNAFVYEKEDGSAYVLKSHLKVMMEEDYLSLKKHSFNPLFGTQTMSQGTVQGVSSLSSKVMREIIVPAIEKEVNEGKNFAMLRQIYSGMVLATWYKRALKESLLGKVYVNRGKVKGVDQADTSANERIYLRYLQAFKRGVYNYIKEDMDQYSNQMIPRKYFSGGFIDDPAAVKTGRVIPASLIPEVDDLAAHRMRWVDSLQEPTQVRSNAMISFSNLPDVQQAAFLASTFKDHQLLDVQLSPRRAKYQGLSPEEALNAYLKDELEILIGQKITPTVFHQWRELVHFIGIEGTHLGIYIYPDQQSGVNNQTQEGLDALIATTVYQRQIIKSGTDTGFADVGYEYEEDRKPFQYTAQPDAFVLYDGIYVPAENLLNRISQMHLSIDGKAVQVRPFVRHEHMNFYHARVSFYIEKGAPNTEENLLNIAAQIKESLNHAMTTLSVRMGGFMTLEANVQGVNKALPLDYLDHHFDEILNRMGYTPGTLFDARKTKTVITADGDGTTYGKPSAPQQLTNEDRAKYDPLLQSLITSGNPVLADSQAYDNLLEYLREGGVYVIISGNDMELTKKRILSNGKNGKPGLPVELRNRLLIVPQGGTGMVFIDAQGNLVELEEYRNNALSEYRDQLVHNLDLVYLGDDHKPDGNDFPGFKKVGFERAVTVTKEADEKVPEQLRGSNIGGLEAGTAKFLQAVVTKAGQSPQQALFTPQGVASIISEVTAGQHNGYQGAIETKAGVMPDGIAGAGSTVLSQARTDALVGTGGNIIRSFLHKIAPYAESRETSPYADIAKVNDVWNAAVDFQTHPDNYTDERLQASNTPVRIEVRGRMSDGTAAQVAIIGIPGAHRQEGLGQLRDLALTSVKEPIIARNDDLTPVGGIDLNAAMLSLHIKRDGKGVPLPVAMQDVEHMHLEGLTPIIRSVSVVKVVPFAPSIAQ